ncbi:MAG: helicase-associated domain-containing protein [Deltaproteobacteria bacterium]|nr:helicase-associated domain-containing protein [Deltaproteobacteria bacterium]
MSTSTASAESPPAPGPADRPLVVQSDGTILLEVAGPAYESARDFLAGFAQLEKSPEYIHTYRLTPLSVWNAAAVGLDYDHVAHGLSALSRYPVPTLVLDFVREQFGRYGRTRLLPTADGRLLLASDEPHVLAEVGADERLAALLGLRQATGFLIDPVHRGALKQAMVRVGYPVDDLCGYVEGAPLDLELRPADGSGAPFGLRPYQVAAVDAFHAGGGPRGGAGVVVLPCGAGKTVVGIGAMARLRSRTLVLTTSTVAVHQWMDELRDKTRLDPDDIGEYTGACKDLKPVTVATYQMLTHRASREGDFPHLALVRDSGWGLIIYDEVHMLPAPVFRATAEIQARRRLGLTATLVREDGREDDVFALIGPKRFDLAWKVLEGQGFIAEALCAELRVELAEERRVAYALANRRDKFRLAAENPAKVRLVEDLLAAHPDEPALVIGQYLDQLAVIARDLGLPLLTGQTPTAERERLYGSFRRGELRALVVSKVANFAIDLPDASLAIQVSGTFGSRQEEAQRLGRILRPKARASRFYTLVSRDTVEQEFARRRQLFLVEQGYRYRIVNASRA